MSIEVFPLPPSGPSLAEITSAITSNAAPSTVTMPAITSSITTNAASSGVTMAAITSAITTNAASSGVTMAAINTAVANNASPYGGTWTNLGTHTTAGTSTLTFSNLGGYKYLRLFYNITPSTPQVQRLRINGDSGGNYFYGMFVQSQSAASNNGSSQFDLGMATGNTIYGVLEVKGSNNTSTPKHFNTLTSATYSNEGGLGGVWSNTSAITSLTLFASTGTWSSVYVNLIGAN